MVHVFLDLLVHAAWKDGKHRGKPIKRGQVFTSITEISRRTGVSYKVVRTVLDRLEDSEELGRQWGNQYSTITVLNYDNYQGQDSDEGQANGQTEGRQRAGRPSQVPIVPCENGPLEGVEGIDITTGGGNKCPHKMIIDIYHSILPELPNVVDWTDDRQKQLRARWNSKAERAHIKWWRQYFKSDRNMPWLMGDNDKGWVANLPWLIKLANFNKVIEGVYNPRGTQKQGGPIDCTTCRLFRLPTATCGKDNPTTCEHFSRI